MALWSGDPPEKDSAECEDATEGGFSGCACCCCCCCCCAGGCDDSWPKRGGTMGVASAGLLLQVDRRVGGRAPTGPYCAPMFSGFFGSGRILPTGGGTFALCLFLSLLKGPPRLLLLLGVLVSSMLFCCCMRGGLSNVGEAVLLLLESVVCFAVGLGCCLSLPFCCWFTASIDVWP